MAYLSCLLFLTLLVTSSTFATEDLLEGSGEGSGELPQQQHLPFTNIVDLVTATAEATTEQKPLTTNNDVEECLPKVDLVFVLDTSGNIEQIYKEHVKWTVELVDTLPVRKDAVRIAALQYAGSPITEFSLGTYSNGTEVSEHLKNIAFQSGVTRTGIALRKAEAELFREDKGARLDASKIIILFTDGLSIDDPLKPAQQLRDDKKVKIYVVSVGSDGFEPEMNRIAGIKGNVYGPKDLQQLKESLHQDIERAQNCPLTSTTIPLNINNNVVIDKDSGLSDMMSMSNATVVFSEGIQADILTPNLAEVENNSSVNIQSFKDQQSEKSNVIVNQEVIAVNGSADMPLSELVKETVKVDPASGQSVVPEPVSTEQVLSQSVSSEPAVPAESGVHSAVPSTVKETGVAQPTSAQAVTVESGASQPLPSESANSQSLSTESGTLQPLVVETVKSETTQAASANSPTSQTVSAEFGAAQPATVQTVSSESSVSHPELSETPQSQAESSVSQLPESTSEKPAVVETAPTAAPLSNVEEEHKHKVLNESKNNESIPLQESIHIPEKQHRTESLKTKNGDLGDLKIANNEIAIGKAEVVPEKLQANDKEGPLNVKVKVPVRPVEPTNELQGHEHKPETVVVQQTTLKTPTVATSKKIVKDKTERPYLYNAQYTTKSPNYSYESYTKKVSSQAESRRLTTRRPSTPKPNIRRTDGTCPVDILFVVDSSGSVKTIYEQQKQYVYDILEEAQIADHEHRTALVQFAGLNHQRTEWSFDTFEEKEDLMQAFAGVRHFTGTTFIGRALDTALKLLSTRRAYVPTIVILLSDGFSQDDATLPAGTIKRSPGVDFYAVSISDLSNTEYLETLTGDPGKVYIGEESEELKRYLIKMFRCEA